MDVYDIKNAPMVGKTKPVSLKHMLKTYCVLSQLETGEWTLVIMRNHASLLDKAFVITDEEAVMELFESEQEELLNLPEFADLRSVDTIAIRTLIRVARGGKWTEEG
ncbi:MAG: hypothetical protein DDT29_00715 [Dehalococcoidia bacterium]|nr:hypothetical protein [Bacillota bacterium]